jgi:hypothetical protein
MKTNITRSSVKPRLMNKVYKNLFLKESAYSVHAVVADCAAIQKGNG